MTEEQAKKKWCPMVRMVAVERANDGSLLNLNKTSFNRMSKMGGLITPNGAECIASDCMMWQYKSEPSAWKKINSAWKERDSELYIPVEWEGGGYCGLTSNT